VTNSGTPSDGLEQHPAHVEPVVFETEDYKQRKVILRHETWHNHILYNIRSGKPGHPELEDHVDDIRGIIEDPEIVAYDPQYTTREHLFGLVPSHAIDGIRPMKVVVEYGENPARVVTAMFMRKITLSSTGGVIYERRKRVKD